MVTSEMVTNVINMCLDDCVEDIDNVTGDEITKIAKRFNQLMIQLKDECEDNISEEKSDV